MTPRKRPPADNTAEKQTPPALAARPEFCHPLKGGIAGMRDLAAMALQAQGIGAETAGLMVADLDAYSDTVFAQVWLIEADTPRFAY